MQGFRSTAMKVVLKAFFSPPFSFVERAHQLACCVNCWREARKANSLSSTADSRTRESDCALHTAPIYPEFPSLSLSLPLFHVMHRRACCFVSLAVAFLSSFVRLTRFDTLMNWIFQKKAGSQDQCRFSCPDQQYHWARSMEGTPSSSSWWNIAKSPEISRRRIAKLFERCDILIRHWAIFSQRDMILRPLISFYWTIFADFQAIRLALEFSGHGRTPLW